RPWTPTLAPVPSDRTSRVDYTTTGGSVHVVCPRPLRRAAGTRRAARAVRPPGAATQEQALVRHATRPDARQAPPGLARPGPHRRPLAVPRPPAQVRL